jgi:nucleoside-diphosphate-sugar epimerase
MSNISPVKPLVLITGATGHIGFRTLAVALQSGYRARVTSRSIASLEKLKQLPSTSPYTSEIEFFEVPDMLRPGAFDKAVEGVDFVIHLAAPIPTPDAANADFKTFFYEPAVHGTVGMLESAAKSETVKRVVLTSSIVVLGPKDGKAGPDDLLPKIDENVDPGNPRLAYRGSKILAHYSADEWMAENSPGFDLVKVMPGYVQGKNEAALNLKELSGGSNEGIVGMLEGRQSDIPKLSATVLVDDVAKVHIGVLDKDKAKGGENFVTSGKPIEWDDVTTIVEKRFPKEVKSRLLPMGGKQKSLKLEYDASRAENALGFTHAGLEEQVVSLVEQYIELKKREA